MLLRTYLDDRGITIPAFAADLGVSVQSVHRYITGERTPHKEVMDKIVSLTNGKVLPNDFFWHRQEVERRRGEATASAVSA